MPSRELLITDLDNTLWDWFHAWYEAYSVLLAQVTKASGLAQTELEREVRTVHRRAGTAEYSNLLNEVPSLVKAAEPDLPSDYFAEAIHAFRSRRRKATKLYPGVLGALVHLRSRGVRIAAYTESQSFWTEWRIQHTGLDGIIDVLYSAEDHRLPEGMSKDDLRTGHRNPHSYGLKVTKHHHTPLGVHKPSPEILQTILCEQGVEPDAAVYIGDSLMKDIAMAQSVGVLDVHAKYGVAHERAEYELLRRVTHWSEADVERERRISHEVGTVVATVTCSSGFDEVLQAFAD